jgi:hypothetical protein
MTKDKGMTWLEMINVRTARVIEAERVIELCRQSFQSLAVEKLLALTVYCSAKYPTDISIHFEWESDPRPGSILGSVVSSALKEFGLVSHTLWIKQKEFGIHALLKL